MIESNIYTIFFNPRSQ